jgi:hypothetical protein
MSSEMFRIMLKDRVSYFAGSPFHHLLDVASAAALSHRQFNSLLAKLGSISEYILTFWCLKISFWSYK